MGLLSSFTPSWVGAGQQDDKRLALEEVRQLQTQGVILPLGHFLEAARRIHAGQVVDAYVHFQSEHGFYEYEVYVLDKTGEVWEIEFNAQTGRMIEHELQIN